MYSSYIRKHYFPVFFIIDVAMYSTIAYIVYKFII
jgi:hypothetical protein